MEFIEVEMTTFFSPHFSFALHFGLHIQLCFAQKNKKKKHEIGRFYSCISLIHSVVASNRCLLVLHNALFFWMVGAFYNQLNFKHHAEIAESDNILIIAHLFIHLFKF